MNETNEMNALTRCFPLIISGVSMRALTPCNRMDSVMPNDEHRVMTFKKKEELLVHRVCCVDGCI